MNFKHLIYIKINYKVLLPKELVAPYICFTSLQKWKDFLGSLTHLYYALLKNDFIFIFSFVMSYKHLGSTILQAPCCLQRRMFVGLAYEGKDIVFKFIIEYSTLTDFGPR
jgi:hypothetical protein